MRDAPRNKAHLRAHDRNPATGGFQFPSSAPGRSTVGEDRVMTLRKLHPKRAVLGVITATATSVVVASVCIGLARGEPRNREPTKYDIALFGDMPYNALGKAQYPNLLADVNKSHVALLSAAAGRRRWRSREKTTLACGHDRRAEVTGLPLASHLVNCLTTTKEAGAANDSARREGPQGRASEHSVTSPLHRRHDPGAA
jgi:hypothetical protein